WARATLGARRGGGTAAPPLAGPAPGRRPPRPPRHPSGSRVDRRAISPSPSRSPWLLQNLDRLVVDRLRQRLNERVDVGDLLIREHPFLVRRHFGDRPAKLPQESVERQLRQQHRTGARAALRDGAVALAAAARLLQL